MKYCLYEIRRPKQTGDCRRYIGVSHYSEKYNPKKRFRKGHMFSKHYIGKFVRKYSDAKMFILVDNLKKEEAYCLEAILVPVDSASRKALKLINECGGGISPPKFADLNQETQKKLQAKRSQLVSGKNNPQYGKTGASHAVAVSFEIQDPNGKKHTSNCIRTFAKCHNLNETCLSRVIRGERKHHKGWHLP